MKIYDEVVWRSVVVQGAAGRVQQEHHLLKFSNILPWHVCQTCFDHRFSLSVAGICDFNSVLFRQHLAESWGGRVCGGTQVDAVPMAEGCSDEGVHPALPQLLHRHCPSSDFIEWIEIRSSCQNQADSVFNHVWHTCYDFPTLCVPILPIKIWEPIRAFLNS